LILQPILDLASICAQKGIKNVILSPGSRCAPLTLAFARHPHLHCRTISDERSAAFVALGMAQQLEKPVILVCTSGSAALNYGPAVAEAYFQQIPLVIITADRPAEWIDQWDGQTIRQPNVFGSHAKASYNFPDEFSHHDKTWHAHRISNEAINLATAFPPGPVHLNVPLREPFYPEENEYFSFANKVPITSDFTGTMAMAEDAKQLIKTALEKFKKILIVPGQQRPDPELSKALSQLVLNHQAVVVSDVISNLQSRETITYHDFFLGGVKENEVLSPDLVISFGKSIISKSLKLFLREGQAEHWHIQRGGYFPDTYQSSGKHIHTQPCLFLKFLQEQLSPTDADFYRQWYGLEKASAVAFPEILDQADFGEFKALHLCIKAIPSPAKIHLANSMAVRYANYIGIRNEEKEVVCNRGTSGIDGSNSTAVGCTFTTKEQVVLVTGDMAFFYDRNAFWHNYSLSNLRIILLNNHAGGIFRMINGPASQPELEEYFETSQRLDASFLAEEHGFEYYKVEDEKALKGVLEDFYQPSVKPKILEVTSKSKVNARIFKEVKAAARGIV
jgi:2-succinyl-5-enolpyruvyl-6-hydroxy-3-cyclohexene-1-carboxylate synthase